VRSCYADRFRSINFNRNRGAMVAHSKTLNLSIEAFRLAPLHSLLSRRIRVPVSRRIFFCFLNQFIQAPFWNCQHTAHDICEVPKFRC
jgi:hypothetical protein